MMTNKAIVKDIMLRSILRMQMQISREKRRKKKKKKKKKAIVNKNTVTVVRLVRLSERSEKE